MRCGGNLPLDFRTTTHPSSLGSTVPNVLSPFCRGALPPSRPVQGPVLGPWNRVGQRGLPGGGSSAWAGGILQGDGPSCLLARFCVNFVAGAHPGSDIAFHFNPRFDGWDKVVFNSHLGGMWGSEEKKRSMPFRKGTHFELVFMVLAEHYKV